MQPNAKSPFARRSRTASSHHGSFGSSRSVSRLTTPVGARRPGTWWICARARTVPLPRRHRRDSAAVALRSSGLQRAGGLGIPAVRQPATAPVCAVTNRRRRRQLKLSRVGAASRRSASASVPAGDAILSGPAHCCASAHPPRRTHTCAFGRSDSRWPRRRFLPRRQ